MNSFRPDVKNQSLPYAVIDTTKIKVSLSQSLQQNHIARLHNFRIVKLDSSFYYQIQQLNDDTLTYISCYNGNILPNGDQLYAAYLAQRFLSEPVNQQQQSSGMHHHTAGADVIGAFSSNEQPKRFTKTTIKNITLRTKYNKEYKSTNVLLPVYRISFNRRDNIRLYIETSTDRLSYAVDTKKALFTSFFSIAHTWSFLDGMGNVKFWLLGGFSALSVFTSLFGFYIYNLTNKKKKTPSIKKNNHSLHRMMGNIFLVTTLLYAFSGAWHCFTKHSTQNQLLQYSHSEFNSADLKLPLTRLTETLNKDEKIYNVSVVKIEDNNYWQLSVIKGKAATKRYIDISSLKELPDGDNKYACSLAYTFSQKPSYSITHVQCLKEFNHSYSMMNKRLPVIEVNFEDKENYYIETSTGYLAAVTSSSDKMEQFSFSNLHMHHYWEMWLGKDAGKTARNTMMIVTTLGLLLVALTGITIYFKKKATKKAG
jgi:hypothetical protein